ncbi:MAG TPA: response regulator [Azospirillum sp.]|nr:response regulator [Azospirillum sp.]
MTDRRPALKRILVVEDEALVALYTQELLEDAGHTVVGLAATGESALALAARERIDLALLDIRLPGGMDGVEVGAALRARHGIPVIFVSGTLDCETLERVSAVEPLACLQKPVRPGELLAAIGRAQS